MKRIISIFICICVMMGVLVGCSPESSIAAKEKQQSRIVMVDEATQNIYISTYIFVDRETGVSYLWVDGYQNGGLTIMTNENGEPLITEIE